jgi:hypothetical protein
VTGFAGPLVARPVLTVATTATLSPGTDQGGQGEDFGKSTPVGFVVLVLFFVAVAFLIRSMTKHLKRVPASFDPPETDVNTAPRAGG